MNFRTYEDLEKLSAELREAAESWGARASEEAATAREQRSAQVPADIDEVAETVEASMDAERLRRCLAGLTELQRESITLAYYGGYSYAQVAALLDTALGTIKTRIRDGLTRLRACLGVS